MKLIRFFLNSFLFLGSSVVLGQVETSRINVTYKHFLLNPTAQIPALFHLKRTAINLSYESFTGIRSDAKDLFLSVNSYLNKTHFIGFQVFNARQTSLFTRSKAHVNYGFRIPISKGNYWVTSSQVGLANVFFASSGVTPGGSDLGLDASLSTSLVLGDWSGGLAVHQLPEASLVPIFVEFKLNRYYETIVSKRSILSKNLQIKNGINAILQNNSLLINTDHHLVVKDQYSLLFSTDILFNNLSVGFNYQGKKDLKKIGASFAYQFIVNGSSNISKLIFQTRVTL